MRIHITLKTTWMMEGILQAQVESIFAVPYVIPAAMRAPVIGYYRVVLVLR